MFEYVFLHVAIQMELNLINAITLYLMDMHALDYKVVMNNVA